MSEQTLAITSLTPYLSSFIKKRHTPVPFFLQLFAELVEMMNILRQPP